MISNLEFYIQSNHHQVRGTIITFPDMQGLKNFINHAPLSQQSNGACLLPEGRINQKERYKIYKKKNLTQKAKANSPKTVKGGAPRLTTMNRPRKYTGQNKAEGLKR